MKKGKVGRREMSYLIEEATPPLRIVEGCSVKEISLARGGSINGEGVDSRNALPCGIYVIKVFSISSCTRVIVGYGEEGRGRRDVL